MAKDYDLFFLCTLVEDIGRIQKLQRTAVASALGLETLQHIYDYADVFHCEVLEDVAAEFIEHKKIPQGNYDNIAICEYTVPTAWTMGDVYTRLISLVHKNSYKSLIEDTFDVLTSWYMNELCNLNSDLYYQWPEYHYECYLAGRIL